MSATPIAFPADPSAWLRLAVADLDAGRSEAALDGCWNAWHALKPGERGRVVAVFIMGMALAGGDARHVLRQILPAVSYYLSGELIGPLPGADPRPEAEMFAFHDGAPRLQP